MSVTQMRTGPWGENCYLLRSGPDSVLIDPGGQAEEIIERAEAERCTVHAVLLTHGHFDHVGAVAPVADHFAAEVLMSSLDESVLKQAKMLRFVFKSNEPMFPPKTWTDLGHVTRELRFGNLAVTALFTPGHTPGGFTFASGDALFTGDTLLAGQTGTAKLPGGNEADLAGSVALLRALPPASRVFPGHGRVAALSTYTDGMVES